MTASPRYKKVRRIPFGLKPNCSHLCQQLSCYVVAWSMIISTPLSCCSITYSAAQLLIATAQLAYPNYVATVWHVYLVYLAMMFLSYLIICLPTKYVSWFNIWATALGIVVLIVTTILLPAMANELNSGKDIFTSVRSPFLARYMRLTKT